MSKRAVVVVDLQNEYLPAGKLPLDGIHDALNNAARVIADARTRGELVVNVRHESADAQAPFFQRGTDGVQIHDAVAPLEGEPVIVKNFPNSFLKTPLKEMLDENGIEEVTVIGAMSHMCIDATARAASDFGYKTKVVHDACATRELEFNGSTVPAAQVHTALMSALAFGYASVISTDEYLAG
ncbi:cysteine hydrolase family protein [Pseudoduganella albidiflava]|uniref:Cysteine hydrolase n=1 Tax=Pseudoduganella albidiflava TaxID=321983 RepID=A0A411WSE0_9BURK|nr:cysteine hydrolase family protein [Pseudoduganella albidiflava]QBH99704.1 cysteine hydrolase [Pseudoduganella albidiflava]GGY62440.1 isochorismatase [Pseudoduganella albidiflava]